VTATWTDAEFIEIIPVPMTESLGTVTGKYPAKDKITSSAVDLLGEESIQRLLHITDTNNPYRFDLRRGALARVAGRGHHFSTKSSRTKRTWSRSIWASSRTATSKSTGINGPSTP
jgi:serine protein kinase